MSVSLFLAFFAVISTQFSVPPSLPDLVHFEQALIDRMPMFSKEVDDLDLVRENNAALENHNLNVVKKFAELLGDHCRAYTKADEKARRMAARKDITWTEYTNLVKPVFASELAKCGGQDSSYVQLLRDAQAKYRLESARFVRRISQLEERQVMCALNPKKCED